MFIYSDGFQAMLVLFLVFFYRPRWSKNHFDIFTEWERAWPFGFSTWSKDCFCADRSCTLIRRDHHLSGMDRSSLFSVSRSASWQSYLRARRDIDPSWGLQPPGEWYLILEIAQRSSRRRWIWHTRDEHCGWQLESFVHPHLRSTDG